MLMTWNHNRELTGLNAHPTLKTIVQTRIMSARMAGNDCSCGELAGPVFTFRPRPEKLGICFGTPVAHRVLHCGNSRKVPHHLSTGPGRS